MQELRLIFDDENGTETSATVRGEAFFIGRHSSCDLAITDARLSREHLRIERFDGEYFASDLGSSNGSTLNGETLTGPMKLNDGDLIVLGGGVELQARFEVTALPAAKVEQATPKTEQEPGPELPTKSVAAESQTSSLPLFIIAPLLGLIVLAFAGGLIYLFSSKNKPPASNNGFQYSSDTDEPINKKKDKPASDDGTPTPSKSIEVNSGDTLPPTDSNTPPSQTPSGEYANIEKSGSLFLREIAANDPRAFITGDQAKRVSSKVKQFSGSSALAANIDSAKKNAAQLRSLATAKNLKPQFLAVAAIAKLGSTRGDVLQTAAGMADVLDKLGTQIGNEFGEDALLMIASYDQGAAGDFLKMRNQLQDLANKYPDSTRQIRTIWFLKEKGQITDNQFDRALTFLAVGVITQNPKDFGVNAEALSL
ncbi:MAG TPA: FHA domain-containing protein [Pyrinomonadaceae bacterium]|nr:FHA domain-containing protein [Pyrinomonadaceae bacterium]